VFCFEIKKTTTHTFSMTKNFHSAEKLEN